jgi:hypothetical protein
MVLFYSEYPIYKLLFHIDVGDCRQLNDNYIFSISSSGKHFIIEILIAQQQKKRVNVAFSSCLNIRHTHKLGDFEMENAYVLLFTNISYFC